MKAIFEFDLPTDEREYKLMNQAIRMQQAFWDINEALRSWNKYGHQIKDADHAVQQIREEFYRIINEYEVDIDL